MDVATLLREVRRRRGLSIRDAADRCGVPRATWGGWESGSSAPSVRRLDEVLAALGHDLELTARLDREPPGEDALRAHLRRSLNARARAALGQQLPTTWQACREQPRLLTGPAAVGIWVPHVVARGPLPLPPAPRTPGCVLVRLLHEDAYRSVVAAVPTPAMLVSQGQANTWPQLRTSARLFAEEGPRDAERRQLPPHRDPDEARELRDLDRALAWAGRGRIPLEPEDSRAWRLDAPATLDAALRQAGLPVRNASRRGGQRRWRF